MIPLAELGDDVKIQDSYMLPKGKKRLKARNKSVV